MRLSCVYSQKPLTDLPKPHKYICTTLKTFYFGPTTRVPRSTSLS